MAATFFFRAVASDGKVRTGSLAGDNEKLIARELRPFRIYDGANELHRATLARRIFRKGLRT